MNELLGFLFGIVSMLGFGIQDAFMIKAARTFGGFRTSFYIILVVTLIMVPLGFFLSASLASPWPYCWASLPSPS